MPIAALLPFLLAQLGLGISSLLGFLSSSKEKPSFYKWHTLIASACWMGVSLVLNSEGRFYFFGFGLLCLCGWAQFRGGRIFKGKIWLSISAGLGLAFGLTWMAQLSQFYLPAACPPSLGTVFLSRTYVGAAFLAVAYMAVAFAYAEKGDSDAIVERLSLALRLIGWFALIRTLWTAAVFLISASVDQAWTSDFLHGLTGSPSMCIILMIRIGIGLALPSILAHSVQRKLNLPITRALKMYVAFIGVAVLLGEASALSLQI